MFDRRMRFTVIGMSDEQTPHWSPEVLDLIAHHRVFSGGKRHHAIVASLLPEGSCWIDITVPLQPVFESYLAEEEILVFASGDPLFFGFANTLRREFPNAEIRVYPYFNSLQLLAHRLLLPYHEMRMVSLTGRPWDRFDQALIEGEAMIGLLTDRQKSPDQIARRMLDYGYDNYRMSVGEALGNRPDERVRTLSLQEAATSEFRFPNCVILERTEVRPRLFGIPESAFDLLDGRVNMITKMPVRLVSLSLLDLRRRRVFWDVGFCTGSVSIEAKTQFPHLRITAFERRESCAGIIERNCRRFGTPGIEAVIGDFMALDLSAYPRPDAVFIGGHGGQLEAMLRRIGDYLSPEGTIVFNSVSEESEKMFLEGIAAIGRPLRNRIRLVVDAHNPIEILQA